MIIPLASAVLAATVGLSPLFPSTVQPSQPPAPAASYHIDGAPPLKVFKTPPTKPHAITPKPAHKPSAPRSAPHKAKPAPTPRRVVTVTLPTGPMHNTAEIYHGLRALGLTHNAAAGVEGNIYQESHGDSYTPSPVGGGLFGCLVENGGSTTGGSVKQELRLLHKYIDRNGSIGDINVHASSPRGAAHYFSDNYEKPG